VKFDGLTGGLPLIDAHLHLQDPRLNNAGDGPVDCSGIGIQLVNGTGPDDWQAVRDIENVEGIMRYKAYGVHPWKANRDLPQDWEESLRSFLKTGALSVGEIGLDNWIEDRDESLQEEVFQRQLQLAHEFNLTPTLHCLRAWGRLYDLLRTGPDLKRGFLVHGFGGSVEMLHQLADIGGHFSFSAYAADRKRKKMRDAVRACPDDRILVETDAPDMVPSEMVVQFALRDSEGNRIHHPKELQTAYVQLSRIRETGVEPFLEQVHSNFHRLFAPSLT